MTKALQAVQSEPAVVSLHSRRRRLAPLPEATVWRELGHLRMGGAEVSAKPNCISRSDADIILSGAADLRLLAAIRVKKNRARNRQFRWPDVPTSPQTWNPLCYIFWVQNGRF